MSCELPCECGVRVTVRLGDAGRRLTCVCGQMVEVPRYTVLRKMIEAPVYREDGADLDRRLLRGQITLAGLGVLMFATEAVLLWKASVPVFDGGHISLRPMIAVRAVVLFCLFGLILTGKLWPRVWLILGLLLSGGVVTVLMMAIEFPLSTVIYSISAHLVAIAMLMFVKTNKSEADYLRS